MDPPFPSREPQAKGEERSRRWWEGWVHSKSPVIPTRAPLSESPAGWLWVQVTGVTLLAVVQVVTCLSDGVLGLPRLRVDDPERLFNAMTLCYVVGVWLLSWREPGSGDNRPRAAGRRWAMRVFSLAPVVAAWLAWASWNYVSWWNCGRYEAAAAETLALASVCEWLVFDHLARLAPGTTFPGLYLHFRAARYAATFTLFALALRGMHGWDEAEPWTEMGCICFPAELLVFIYPCLLLVGAMPLLISTAYAARRRERLGPAARPAEAPSSDAQRNTVR